VENTPSTYHHLQPGPKKHREEQEKETVEEEAEMQKREERTKTNSSSEMGRGAQERTKPGGTEPSCSSHHLRERVYIAPALVWILGRYTASAVVGFLWKREGRAIFLERESF
jgi:hypothetical protein